MEDELENFVKIFKRHVFDSKSSMATIAECVSTVSKHCAEVRNVFIVHAHVYISRDRM